MHLFAEKSAVFFTFDEWINKSLSIRGIKVYFDDYGKPQPDLEIGWFAAGYSVYSFMQSRYPWLMYEYAEPIRNHAGEIDEHVLSVRLTDEACMFKALEKFYKDGPSYPDPNAPSDPEELSEDEEMEFAMRRAMERDSD